MPGLRIPSPARVIVRGRDRQTCVVCKMRGEDWHHRRSRVVRDEHTHCPCNGVTLCGKGNTTGDHGYVHTNPFEARSHGLIISKYDSRMPFEVPLLYEVDPPRWVLLGCKGEITPCDAP